MQVTREELNPCTLKLTIVCDPQEVTAGFDRAYKQIAKKVKLPGFRPGHAPRAMVEGMISKEELYDEAAEHIVRNSFKKALEQEGIQPDQSVRPTVELQTLDKDKSEAQYTAKVPLPPTVTLGEYKGLPLEKPAVEVSDEEIDRQIEEFRKRRQTREVVTDRGVEEGDVAVVNIKPEGDTGEGHTFMSVAGQLFPELDEALRSMKVEEMKSLELTFPENFTEKEWAGQTKKVTVTLNSLSAVKLPELDDTFAQSLQTENVDDLRTRIRDGIRSAKESMLRDLVSEQLLDKLHERSEVNVSDNMWEQLAQRRLEETAHEQQRLGKNLEQYAAENGMTIEQLIQAWGEKAKMHVERALLIREVFTAEKMQLTNQELNVELQGMAQEYNVDLEQMVAMLRENNAVDELHFRAISRKVGDFLESNATATEAAATEEEAPAVEAEATPEAPAEEAAPEATAEETKEEEKTAE
ncbi:MAG: trigger factor [Fimbriimonas sp.]